MNEEWSYDMTDKEKDPLLLKNQLCFPLYAAARKIVAAYNPYLKKIGLTYAQYVTMMVLWEEKAISMHELGKRLFLDSGTLTPVLKKLEGMGYLCRSRKPEDERIVLVRLTEGGVALRQEAKKIPLAMGCMLQEKGLTLTLEEIEHLKKELYRILHALEE